MGRNEVNLKVAPEIRDRLAAEAARQKRTLGATLSVLLDTVDQYRGEWAEGSGGRPHPLDGPGDEAGA